MPGTGQRIRIEIYPTADGGFQIVCCGSNIYRMNAGTPAELEKKVCQYLDWITADPRHYDPENYPGVARFRCHAGDHK